MKQETKWVHVIPTDAKTGAISVPIYQTSTFEQRAPGVHNGFDYSRSNNPTRKALEDVIATLEEGDQGFAFASGLAAVDAVVKLLNQGDEIIAVDDIYGGSFRLFDQVYSRFGIKVSYVDTGDVENISQAITDRTRFIWIESPTNPTLKISNISAISELAKSNGIQVVVDNTFASPALQKPIELGADIVIHSGTKYLAGHSDVIAGLVVTATPDLSAAIKFIQNATGGILAPWDSWLVLRGIQTLGLRIEKQCENAFRVAKFLITRPEVDKVYYPGLISHRNHKIAAQQQKAYGGVVSFSLKKDTEIQAEHFCTSTNYFKLAESLGGVKSLLCHPATMTHKSTPLIARRKAGIQDSLIRLSCGIEHYSDLIADLEQAFERTLEKSLEKAQIEWK
jgi:cystathionine beta-lyase/cystathionine gamma-synthase